MYIIHNIIPYYTIVYHTILIELDDRNILTGNSDQFDGKNPWVSGVDFPLNQSIEIHIVVNPHHYTILYHIIPYYTILYHISVIPYYTIVYHTIPSLFRCKNPSHPRLNEPTKAPVKAVMISHAWDEGFVDLLLALSVAPQKGPLWAREPGAEQGGG